ncbi:MAG: hypothetical protein LLG02_16315 [Pelosinus sp.]|nr:hypothetical protein [Pelosinus sp.]
MNNLPLPKDIAAIIPQYIGREDHTVIIANTGEKFSYTNRLKTILRNIAHELCLDLGAIKKTTAKATQQAILQPLPLSPVLLLIPVKVRIPFELGQPSMGYVNFYSITNILDEKTAKQALPYRASIELCCGNRLPVVWTSSTIKKQIRYARLSLVEKSAAQICSDSQPSTTHLVLLAQKFIDFMRHSASGLDI